MRIRLDYLNGLTRLINIESATPPLYIKIPEAVKMKVVAFDELKHPDHVPLVKIRTFRLEDNGEVPHYLEVEEDVA